MDKLSLARNTLTNDQISLVVISSNGDVSTYTDKGVKNLLKFYDEDPNTNLAASFIGDKIIGKAAAILLVHFQVKTCYAKTISHAGLDFLIANDVEVFYDDLVEKISRRDDQTKMCPLESCVLNSTTVEEGLKLLLDFRNSKK